MASVLLAGCGSSSVPTTAAPTAATSEGQVVKGADFSMVVPKDWFVLNMQDLDAKGIEARMRGTKYEKGLPAVQGFAGGEMVRFFAFVPEFESPTITGNFNLVILPADAEPSVVLDANEKQMKTIGKNVAVLKDFSDIPNSRAWSMDLVAMPVKTVSLVSAQNKKQYVLTLTIPGTGDLEKAKTTAKRVFASFQAR